MKNFITPDPWEKCKHWIPSRQQVLAFVIRFLIFQLASPHFHEQSTNLFPSAKAKSSGYVELNITGTLKQFIASNLGFFALDALNHFGRALSGAFNACFRNGNTVEHLVV